MAKRLEAKALKGAFARGKTKRNLDFLVPAKEGSAKQPPAEAAPTKPTELARSGPQRRKQAATKRTTAKRTAAKRKVTKRASTHAKAQAKAKPTQAKGTKPRRTAKPKAPAKPKLEAKPAEAEPTPVEAPVTVAAPGSQATLVLHDAAKAADLLRAESEISVTALYDGWAPAAPYQRPGLLRRLRGRIRRACEGLIGAAVRGALGPPRG